MILTKIIGIMILLVICIVLAKLIFEISGTLLKIAAHLLAGWVLLTIVNFIPGIHVPLNIITLLISGFGGVFGTFILVLIYLL